MRKVEELAILNEIGAKVASTLDLDAILSYIMQTVKDIFNVEACSLMLLDEKERLLRFKLSFGKGAKEVKTLSFSADQGLAGWMVREKKPLLVLDVQKDPRFYRQIDRKTGLTTRDMIGVPLLVKDRVIGVLEAINKMDGTFSKGDLRFLSSIATTVAQAIENARLFDELNKAYADLLEHKKQIEESRNTLRTIFDGIGDVLVIVDKELRIVAANLAAARTAGTTVDELIGQPCHVAFLGNPEVASSKGPVQETFRKKKRAYHLYKFTVKGDIREWEVHTYPLFDNAGDVTRVVVFGRDVTERRRLEASMGRTAKLAAVGRLAAGTAHELGNPLTAILGNAALLHRFLPQTSAAYDLADAILEAAERARGILRSLLDYTRQEQYTFTPTDINATLEWSLSLLKYSFDEGGISVHKSLAGELPQVVASESHLRTLWVNLLLNAVDAVKAAREERDEFEGVLELSSLLLDDEKAVRVTVRDNGVGIKEDSMARLFEPFFTTKKPGEGTGLGLYICHTIVEQHSGRIEVQSVEGQGTQFSVTLPIDGPPLV